jgi:hypothetical protein
MFEWKCGIDPDGMTYFIPYNREQPRAYKKYPR